MSFSHIVLTVSDLNSSKTFYEKVLSPLGFSIADFQPDNYYRLTNGLDMVIVLSQVGQKYSDITYHRKGVGLNHLAICVDSMDSVDAYEKHLNKLGIKILGDGKSYMNYRKGYYSLLFEDPDRIMIEIVWHDNFYFSKENVEA